MSKVLSENKLFKRHATGKHSYCRKLNVLEEPECPYRVDIGAFCSIAENVTLYLQADHIKDYVTTYPFTESRWEYKIKKAPRVCSKGDIKIGNDVWIGRNASILSGVHIDDGAIIGAESVVAMYIPPYAIAVGNPVRIVGYRFDAETIRRLLAIKWWNWEDKKIKENVALLLDRPEEFVKRHYES